MSLELEGLSESLEVFHREHPHVHYGQEQCNVLLYHCQSLLRQIQVGRQMRIDAMPSTSEDLVVKDTCHAVTSCVSSLSQKSLAWCLLCLDKARDSLDAAEKVLIDVFTKYKLDWKGIQTDLGRARKQDLKNLKARLRTLAASDSLASSLQDGHEVKELATAFTKRIRNLNPVNLDNESSEVDSILRVAATALQRVCQRSPDYEIPSWCVTSFEVIIDTDDESRVVGRGAFGRVVRGKWNGKAVAVKEIFTTSESSMKVAVESIRHEVQIWSGISHPNILPFYGACLESSKPFIISKLCLAGNSLDYIKRFPFPDRIRLLHDISVGMVYLHEQSIIHADLKASNILIGDSDEAMIADFGLSQLQDQFSSLHVTRVSTEKVGGTFRWMAPEVMVGKGLNKPADLYGFALTAWEFYTRGGIPLASVADPKLFFALVTQGERPKRPTEIGDEMWEVVQTCWRPDPWERPEFVEIERRLASFMTRSESEHRYHSDVHFTDAAAARAAICQPQEDVLLKAATMLRHHSEGPVPSSHTSTPADEKVHLPSRHRKRRSTISSPAEAERPSFLKGLVHKTFLKSPRSVSASHAPTNGHDGANSARNDKDFMLYARALPSLSSLLAESPDSPQMDAVLAVLYNLSLTSEGVSEVLIEQELIPAIVRRLQWPNLLENEEYLLTGVVANLACHGKARTVLIKQPFLLSALVTSLTPSKPVVVLENVTRCLYNLLTDDGSHRIIAKHEGVVSGLVHLLSITISSLIIRNVLGCLTNLSHLEPGKSVILSDPEALDTLIRTVDRGAETIMKEQALLCLGNLCADDRGAAVLLNHSGLIPSLSTCLSDSPTSAITSQALRCLRNLAKSSSHEDILGQAAIMSTVTDVLAARASSHRQKYALHLIHRLISSDAGKEWLRGENKVIGNLQWFVDNGSFEERTRASACLKAI